MGEWNANNLSPGLHEHGEDDTQEIENDNWTGYERLGNWVDCGGNDGGDDEGTDDREAPPA